MAEKSTLVEKILLFVFFTAFAGIILFLSLRWNYVEDDADTNSVVSFQYETVSKPLKTKVPSDAAASDDGPASSDSMSDSSDSSLASSGSGVASDTGGETNGSIHIININTASLEELDLLPGIGEKRAKAIIEYRETVSPFESIEDIKNVKGIGDGIFDKIKDLITVE